MWGPQNALKIVQNSIENEIKICSLFWLICWSIFDRFLVDFGSQNRLKNWSKKLIKLLIDFWFIWLDIWRIFEPSDLQRLSSRVYESSIFIILRFGYQDHFLIDFEAISVPNGSKSIKKVIKNIDFSDWFLASFGVQVGAKLAPKFDHIGYQNMIKKIIKKKVTRATRLIWVLAPNKPFGPAPPDPQMP